MKEKSKYLNVECEILLLAATDVITTSAEAGTSGGNLDDDGWT